MLSELDLVLPTMGAPGRPVSAAGAPAARRFGGAASALLAGLACLVLGVPVLGLLAGYRTMIVAGGSMEPYASVGDAVVLRASTPEALQRGDIITFHPLRGHGLVTHRVLRSTRIEGAVHFQTQGDANATPDANLVPGTNVMGRVVLRVPDLGVFYAFATSTIGRIVLVVLPALILAWGEIRTLWPRLSLRGRVRGGIGRHASAAAIVICLVVGFAGPAAGLFMKTSTVPSNAFATSSVNAPNLTSAVGSSTLLNCRVTLNWTAPATGIAPDGYDIYRSTTNGGPYSLVQHVGVSTSFVNNGLAANTTYYYVLRSSRSSWRSANSNQRSATTPLLCV